MRRIILACILCATLIAAAPAFPRIDAATTTRCAAAATGACVGGSPNTIPSAASSCTPSRPHASGTSVETIDTAYGPRTYRLHVPSSYTGLNAVPLVFGIHGASSSAAEFEGYTGYSAKADSEGFIVVYPQGVATTLITFVHFNAWQLPSPPEPDDVGFVGSVLDTLLLQLCIDPARVFATGYSNGAMLATRLACSLSSRIAAFAPVAGAYYPPDWTTYLTETCPDAKPVPMIAFHGTADTAVPFNGGPSGPASPIYRLPLDNNDPSEDVLSDWAAHNDCVSPRQESQIDTEVRLIRYAGCAQGATAQLYIVDGGGHTWPGAIDIPPLGYTTHQISATDLTWSFFSTFPLSSRLSVGGIAEPPPLAELPATPATASDRSFAYALAVTALMAGVVAAAIAWRVRPHR